MDNAKKIELTAEGRQKLVDELAYREGEKHDEIVERIKEARGFGDLSENSEYDAAKEEEARNAARVNEIRQILSQAVIVEAGTGRGLTVSIGTTVELKDEKGKASTFTIVGTTETNSLEHEDLQRVPGRQSPCRPQEGRHRGGRGAVWQDQDVHDRVDQALAPTDEKPKRRPVSASAGAGRAYLKGTPWLRTTPRPRPQPTSARCVARAARPSSTRA